MVLTVDGEDEETTAGALGLYWSNENSIQEELEKYAGGSLIRQYMVEKDLKETPLELRLRHPWMRRR